MYVIPLGCSENPQWKVVKLHLLPHPHLLLPHQLPHPRQQHHLQHLHLHHLHLVRGQPLQNLNDRRNPRMNQSRSRKRRSRPLNHRLQAKYRKGKWSLSGITNFTQKLSQLMSLLIQWHMLWKFYRFAISSTQKSMKEIRLEAGVGMAQWWEYSPTTNVARDRFPDSTPYVALLLIRNTTL